MSPLIYRMTGVRVEFLVQRPTGKVEMVLRLGKQDRKLRFDEGCDIQWTGNMYVCTQPANGAVLTHS